MTDKPRSKRKRAEQDTASPIPFHERFNIALDLTEVQQRFVNRLSNDIFDFFFERLVDQPTKLRACKMVANSLGVRYNALFDLEDYTRGDYYHSLQAIEAAYKALQQHEQDVFDRIMQSAVSMSEIDLGISWKDGIFVRTGAKLLDEELVNEPLRWLSQPRYRNVLEPFEKGLRHYLEATRRPELLADVVTDMYEALEALAKIITGRAAKDLSENRESFVNKLRLSEHYKKMLKEYISYACEYRHGVEETRERAAPSPKEVEAFVYATGLFIRLSIAEEPSNSSAPGT